MSQQLKAATYNIRHARGLDDKVDLDRIAQVISDMKVDIIGLQEVDDRWPRSGSIDQALYLADVLGMHHVFGAGFSKGSSRFGNAVLSHHPILYCEVFRMPSSREPRALIQTRIDMDDTILEFYVTHLGLKTQERIDHINRIIIPTIDTVWPRILVGDFNCRPDSKEAKLLKTSLRDVCTEDGFYTYPSGQPNERIDYIIVSEQITQQEVQVVDSRASDHCPLAAILSLL